MSSWQAGESIVDAFLRIAVDIDEIDGDPMQFVQRNVQRPLAVRTDLDSFSEAEAYALMTNGHLMTEQAHMTEQALKNEPILGLTVKPSAREPWPFLDFLPLMKQPGEDNPLVKQLKVANSLVFKVWYLVRYLQILPGLLALALLCQLGFAAFEWWSSRVVELTVGQVMLALLMAMLSLAGVGFLTKIINYKKTVTENLIGLGMATLGFLASRLHLYVFDRIFLRKGRLSSLLVKR